MTYLTTQGYQPRNDYVEQYLLTGKVLYEADASTWSAFTVTYGLTKDDEKNFEQTLVEAILNGLPFCLHSPYISQMLEVEDIL
jgi:hypothetical protein